MKELHALIRDLNTQYSVAIMRASVARDAGNGLVENQEMTKAYVLRDTIKKIEKIVEGK